MKPRPLSLVWLALALVGARLLAGSSPLAPEGPLEAVPRGPAFEEIRPLKAPTPAGLAVREGDRLAICGDSITEQRMYSRILETYLTVCVPELKVTTRQYGWSGETAEGFLHRMTNDCLRFRPTLATTCYGMNDHRYRAYDDANGRWYRENMAAIVAAFQGAGARVVVGSPGCVGRIPDWAKDNHASAEQMNRNLCALRNIDIELAASTASRFADVFWPMLNAMVSAHERYGADYAVPGKDGVHPDWSGQVIMAYAFLKALGFDGDLGTVTMDLGADRAEATGGHQVMSCAKGAVTIRSPRYPFCSIGTSDRDNSIRSGMTLVPFNQDLNRFVLIVKSVPTVEARVTWGGATKQFSASQLAAGVNLAEAFQVNPFSEAFAAVDAAVAAKQEYETRQIKTLFHGPEGRVDMEGTVALTERTREPLAKAVSTAFVPVTHTIRIEPVSP